MNNLENSIVQHRKKDQIQDTKQKKFPKSGIVNE